MRVTLSPAPARILPLLTAVVLVLAPGRTLRADKTLVAEPAGRDAVTRLRVVIAADAPLVEVGFDRGLVLHGLARITAGGGVARVDSGGRVCRVQSEGPHGEAECVLVVAGLAGNASVAWRLILPAGGTAVAEVYNANGPAPPRLVDRIESQGRMTAMSSATGALLDGATAPGPAAPPLVLAAYYPWFIHQTWDSPKLLDHPLTRYSTEQLAEVVPVFRQAFGAGIDAFAVSWQGRNTSVTVAFQAAAETGLKLAILMETLGATATHHSTAVDPDTVVSWLEEIVDVYASKPAYLRLAGRPVVFVYAAGSLPPARWAEIVARVRDSGRNPVLIADSSDPAYLAVFDGAFNYSVVAKPADELAGFERTMTLATRSFSLLHGGATRIAVSTVSPGYDDTKLHDHDPHLVVHRAGGALYDQQWRAAIASQSDWVFITSWNEWYENTEIEPGILYGNAYLQATAAWAARFGCTPSPASKGDAVAPGQRRCR